MQLEEVLAFRKAASSWPSTIEKKKLNAHVANRVYRLRHKDVEELKRRRRERDRLRYAKNPERIRNQSSNYRKANPEKARAVVAAWRARNPEYNKRHAREWYRKNKERHREAHRLYKIRRRKTDPSFRLANTLRLRVRNAFKRADVTKPETTLKLTGCTPKELVAHLERQFLPGMTWENYGKAWQVDHEVPVALFDLTSEEQRRHCFHYSNLQPMWSRDNKAKGARLIKPVP
jgi:hypothetical protein